MKSKRNADLSRISRDLVNTFVQSDLCNVISLNCEAVVVESFLLVNFLEQSSVSNHKANCVVNKRNVFLWV